MQYFPEKAAAPRSGSAIAKMTYVVGFAIAVVVMTDAKINSVAKTFVIDGFVGRQHPQLKSDNINRCGRKGSVELILKRKAAKPFHM